MKTTKPSVPNRITAFVASQKFFRIVVGVLIVQAAWIALSGRYAMAFDENFHLGIIKLYSHRILPFWGGQPAGANAYGAVARDPSYLYQYLMSFPYRLTNLFTHDQTIQVIILRFIDIGLFASSLPLFRRLLLRTGASRAVTNATLAAFVLLPIVPLLAAQINYDDLLMPLVPLTLLLTLKIDRELRTRKRINVQLLILLLIACLLTSLVKYAFLPIFAAIIIYLAVQLWRTYWKTGKLRSSFCVGFVSIAPRMRWLLVAAVVLSLGLFGERYAVNMVRYHSPVPACGQVLTVKQCSAYSPWLRDYDLAQSKPSTGLTRSPVVFTADWLYGMWLRTFFAVDGVYTNFQTRGPLLIPGVGAVVIGAAAVVALVVTVRRLFRKYSQSALWLFLLVSGFYILALWFDEYKDFLRTGYPEAINGRYLLPVALPCMLLGSLALVEVARHLQVAKVVMGGAIVLTLLWGGGALTYILRSNDAWYWPNSRLVQDANHAVQHVLGPITPGYDKPVEFVH